MSFVRADAFVMPVITAETPKREKAAETVLEQEEALSAAWAEGPP